MKAETKPCGGGRYLSKCLLLRISQLKQAVVLECQLSGDALLHLEAAPRAMAHSHETHPPPHTGGAVPPRCFDLMSSPGIRAD